MKLRPLSLGAALAALLCASFAVPDAADARSRNRRNYAEEMRQDDLRKEREEERERLRRQRMEHQEEMQRSWQEHSERQQQRYLDHRERQTDKWIDHLDGNERQREPAAPAATGTCIYGPGDKVIHQPKGVVCKK